MPASRNVLGLSQNLNTCGDIGAKLSRHTQKELKYLLVSYQTTVYLFWISTSETTESLQTNVN